MSREILTAPDGTLWERIAYDDEPPPVLHRRVRGAPCEAEVGRMLAGETLHAALARHRKRRCPSCKARIYRVAVPMSRTTRIEGVA